MGLSDHEAAGSPAAAPGGCEDQHEQVNDNLAAVASPQGRKPAARWDDMSGRLPGGGRLLNRRESGRLLNRRESGLLLSRQGGGGNGLQKCAAVHDLIYRKRMAPGVQYSRPCIQALRYVVAPNHLGRGPAVPAVPFPHTGVAGGHQPRGGRLAVTPAIIDT